MVLYTVTASTTVVSQPALILEKMEPAQHCRREFVSQDASVLMVWSGKGINVWNQSSAKTVRLLWRKNQTYMHFFVLRCL